MDDDPPRPVAAHVIGESLDRLSVADFDARLAKLRREITRLEAAKTRKQTHLNEAASLFGGKS